MKVGDFKLGARQGNPALENPQPGDVVHYPSGASYRVARDGKWERISAAEREQLISLSSSLNVAMRPLAP